MIVREYRSEDCKELLRLFYETVHAVNARDYTKEQLDAWATGKEDAARWNKSFKEHFCLVAEESGRLVGFGDIDKTGYLDRLYVHKDFQGRGIASALCDRLEERAEGKIVTHASVTAKPFFERRGYRAVRDSGWRETECFLPIMSWKK